MDDCCAVCAEPLEWVAYGPCLHRDVCSTCVARLRFICDDRCCCICKTDCGVVFVTKALGDYTRMISDFSALPSDPREGKAGSYWYHEDTNAFFDDMDQYKMVKAMCRLSCSVCDNMEEQSHDASRRRARFRNIEQLKGHLFHRHKLLMCSLCLEGRKVFICEQKLYSRAQLNQHISTGDSEVDGTESERGGFMGHPMCEFCRTPFYGDNELYTHMSTEHFTCFICQRQHPGQYEYYKNYDDLEIHFRQGHFLCEDEACLAKKFIVFTSESEMKRHNAIEHGGRMSRSKRNAALQIPTSFRYKRNEQDQRRGRGGGGRMFHRDSSENQLSMAIEASLQMANAAQTFQDPSSSGQVAVDDGNADIDSIVQPFESLGTSSSERSRYLQALGGQNAGNAPLGDSSFPPLPIASSNDQQRSKHELEGSSSNTMAARLRRHGNRKVSVINSGNGWPAPGRGPVQSSNNPTPAQSRLPTNVTAGVSRNSGQMKTAINSGPSLSTYAKTAHGQSSAGSLRDTRDNGRIVHSSSAPNLIESNSVEASMSDFPPVSAAQLSKLRVNTWSSDFPPVSAAQVSTLPANTRSSDFPPVSAVQVSKLPANTQSSDFPPISAAQVSKLPANTRPSLNVENVHTANKSLVEKIRGALDFDEDRYTLFKDISAQYRLGTVDTDTYLDCVQQFGLSHLVLELARLCPDAQKQKELIDAHNASFKRNDLQEKGWGRGSTNAHLKDSNISKKGKGKSTDRSGSNPTDRLADSFLSSVHQLQSSHKPTEEKLEVLSRGDYRTNKGKIKIEQHIDTSSGNQPLKISGQKETSVRSVSNQNREDAGTGGKQRKKSSKFLRVRLGDGSASALLDFDKEPDPGPTDSLQGNNSDPGVLPVRGVWRKGGGQKLFS